MDLASFTTPACTGWQRSRRLDCSAWTCAEADWSRPWHFVTQNNLGELALGGGMPQWSFLLQMSDVWVDADVHQFHNGFIARPTNEPSLEVMVFCPAPGVLVGELAGDVTPVLFSAELEVEGDEDAVEQTIALEGYTVRLQRRPGRFVLSVNGEGQDAAGYQDVDVAAAFEREFVIRQPFFESAESGQDSVACALALEDLVAALRPSAGPFRQRWSQADTNLADFQQLYALVRIWSLIDKAVGRDLVRSALDVQQEDGRIPQQIEDGLIDEGFALPVLTWCIAEVDDEEAEPDFLNQTLGGAYDALAYVLYVTGAGDNTALAWPEADDALLPDLWDENLQAADLHALVLREAELLAALSQRCDLDRDGVALQEWIKHVDSGLESLWDEKERFYANRYRGGVAVLRRSAAGIMPLLVASLAVPRRTTVGSALEFRYKLMQSAGLLSWERWDDDQAEPPRQPTIQLLALDALNQPQTERQFERLRTRLRSAEIDRSDSDPQASVEQELEVLDPEAAAMRLVLYHTPSVTDTVYANVPPAVVWLDKHRFTLMYSFLAVTLLAVFIIFSTRVFFRKEFSAGEARLLASSAERSYSLGNFDDAIDSYHLLIERAPTEVARKLYTYRLGQTYFRSRNFAAAEKQYRQVLDQRSAYEVKAHYNLALSLYRQQRYAEAEECMISFIEKFDADYPEYRDLAAEALDVFRKQLEQR